VACVSSKALFETDQSEGAVARESSGFETKKDPQLRESYFLSNLGSVDQRNVSSLRILFGGRCVGIQEKVWGRTKKKKAA